MKRDVGNDGLVRGKYVEVSTPLQNDGVVRWKRVTATYEGEIMDMKASVLQHDTPENCGAVIKGRCEQCTTMCFCGTKLKQ
ncbi:hypothetical protein E2C01_059095 [Portunus trituberculatus]|uniref:Uncharacterized protein n=1 Tax=Portunus trituberculatus TaxID=210409 RepID=A0A5B7H1L6_PORTR|nr:hypothetical protein [Portunus trituberculatus]